MSVINKILPYTINHMGSASATPKSLGFFDRSFNELDFTIDYGVLSTSRYLVHIPETEYYITLGYTSLHNMPKFGKLGGGSVTGTNTVGADVTGAAIATMGRSSNKRYLCFGSDYEVSVFDLNRMEVVFGKSGLINSLWGGWLATCTNDLSKVFAISQYNRGLKCFDGSTGNELWNTAISYANAIKYDDATGDLWAMAGGSAHRVNPTDGTIIESIASNVSNASNNNTSTNTSPDGRFISIGAYDGTHRFFDTLNKEWRSFGLTQTTNSCVWLSDSMVCTKYNKDSYLYEIPDLSMEYSIRHEPAFRNSYTYNSDKNLIVGEYGKFEASVDVTDNSGETDFVIEAFYKGHLVGKKFINNPTSPISVRVAVDYPVDVRVSGKKRMLREPSKTYSVSDQIQVLDTGYIYECTTGGTTDAIAPPYPVSGSITDGTAVFLTKHKIANTVEHSHVVPTPL